MTQNKTEKSHQNAIVVRYGALPAIVAVILLLMAASFLVGFFRGQRYKAEQFLERFTHDTLSDQIYSSMFSLYDSGFESPLNTGSEQKDEEPLSESKASEDVEQDVVESVSDEEDDGSEIAENGSAVERVADLSTNYYAQLIGFGSRNRAEAFVKKLANRGIQVQLQKRLGKSQKNGKAITWYQVTTPIFSDRHTLEALTARLAKEEKLHDIRIITLT